MLSAEAGKLYKEAKASSQSLSEQVLSGLIDGGPISRARLTCLHKEPAWCVGLLDDLDCAQQQKRPTGELCGAKLTIGARPEGASSAGLSDPKSMQGVLGDFTPVKVLIDQAGRTGRITKEVL